MSALRYEGAEVNTSLAKTEAQLLNQKIKDNDSSHEDVIRILTTRSKAQLLATFNDYHNQFGNPINKVSAHYATTFLFTLYLMESKRKKAKFYLRLSVVRLFFFFFFHFHSLTGLEV